MAENVTLGLFNDEAINPAKIVLSGTRAGAGADVTLVEVVISLPGSVAIAYSIIADGNTPPVPAEFIDEVNGPSDLRFKPAGLGFSLTARLTVAAAGDVPFFGRSFESTGGVDLRLEVQLPGTSAATPAPPFAVLTARGRIQVATGVFASVAFDYRVVIDDVPTSFPNSVRPAFEVVPPSELPWPVQRLPWPGFPQLPAFPIRLPSYTFDVAVPPLRVGCKAIDISVAGDGTVRVHVEQLGITGNSGALTGSFDLVFANGDVRVENASFPDLAGLTNLTYRPLADGCMGFDWQNASVDPLVALVTSELSDPTAAGNSVQLRVHTSGTEIEEVRLDWGGPAGTDLQLPGFNIELPAVEMISLVASRSDDTTPHLLMAVTIESQKVIHAFTTFCWPLDDRREMLRDGKGQPDSDKLIELTLTSKTPVSLVLFDLPLGSGTPRFVQQLVTPLDPLSELELNAGIDDGGEFVSGLFDACPPTSLELAKISQRDWDLDFQFGNPFQLPFLNFDNGPLGKQFVDVKLTSKTIDPDNLSIKCALAITVAIGDTLKFDTSVEVKFLIERMAFEVNHSQGLWLSIPPGSGPKNFLGLNWNLIPSASRQLIPGSITPDNLNGVFVDSAAFILVTKHSNYEVRMAPGAALEISYDRATSHEEPIVFNVSDFALTPKGINLRAEVSDKAARFNGLETQFRFTSGVLQIHENRIAGFTIAGTGPLPPALVGDAVADVSLQFGQTADSNLRLVRGAAKIKGSNLLQCKPSRFEFSLDGLGLEFVDDGHADHLYFTLSGRARYAPLAGDNPSGPLAWLPNIEIQLVDCPLTGNMQVIAQHVKFMVELPKKVRFSLLGCFEMEIRGIGFLPQFDKIKDNGRPTSAMQLAGQVMFAEGGGDVLETKVEFHNLHVALPRPGTFVPRLYFKGLSIQIKQGESFALAGEVEFFNDEPVDTNPDGTPIIGDGFAGSGMIQVQGLPQISATFAFLRVRTEADQTWKRAWFLYLEAREMSIQIPVIEIFIREIGLGFGYRYTLASIKASDTINDPRLLLKELKRLSRTQGNLSKRDQWRVDLENPGEGPRWTIAFRAMISQTSSQAGPFGDYDAEAEREIDCLFLLDVVVALRSDLTFFMAGRAWLNTNYEDFNSDHGAVDSGIRDRPLLSAFVLLSPRQKRLLANLSSNPDVAFGDHPPLPDFIKTALRSSKYTATLLVEPGLFHYELGWPNQLQWDGELGPLKAEFRGGTIFRVSRSELVVGNSFLARGTLDLEAGFDAGFIGARLTAFAQVAYGARYIGVLAFDDPTANSAFYGAVGVEIRVGVSIDFWMEIDLGIKTIKRGFHFSFDLTFTAALEVGITLDSAAGARGIATIAVELMGHNVEFHVHVGLLEDAVNKAIARTEKFLHIGLEAEDVEPVPGTSAQPLAAPIGAVPLNAGIVAAVASLALPQSAGVPENDDDEQRYRDALDEGPKPPDNYSLVTIRAPGFVDAMQQGKQRVYFLLVPAAPGAGQPSRFYAVPTATMNTVTSDFTWEFTPTANVAVNGFDPLTGNEVIVAAGSISWKVDWDYLFPPQPVFDTNGKPTGTSPVTDFKLHQFFTAAYLNDRIQLPTQKIGDPTPFQPSDSLADDRVHNPTEAAYETAVRGALDQVAAPYFKFDDQSSYDQQLKEAFQPDTTIYSSTGKADPDNIPNSVNETRRAIQLRGTILHSMLRDIQRYAALDGRTDAAAVQEMADLRANSLAFKMGVVFCATGPEVDLHWLELQTTTHSLKQRKAVASTAADSDSIPVLLFNKSGHSFLRRSPAFARIRKYEHANTIAVAWELRWDNVGPLSGSAAQDNPEHHLSHYKVHRLHLDGNDPEVEFTLKQGAVMHRSLKGKGIEPLTAVRLLPRFQLVDHFEAETTADISALTESGKTYLYTIVPVDLAGNESPRPLSIVAARYPADPPLVPTDGELVLEYRLEDKQEKWPTPLPLEPKVRTEDLIVRFQWSEPVPPPKIIPPASATYRLVFRRENALPVGFYGADSDTRGGRTAGFPVTNARTLRTDVSIDIPRIDFERRNLSPVPDSDNDGEPRRADSGRVVQQIDLTTNELVKIGVLSKDNVWRPEAWRVFIQTISPNHGDSSTGIPSALAAVTVRLRFVQKLTPQPVLAASEERQFGLLEWLPDPIRFNLLPPDDQTSLAGFAQIPMPVLDSDLTDQWTYPLTKTLDQTVPGLRFEPHPERFRALRMKFNQGPSGQTTHPIALHASYRLYEFDADSNTGDSLAFDSEHPDFDRWQQRAGMRQVQQIELLPAEDLPLVPSDTANPQAWDVWTPTTSRRILLRRQMIADHTWPEATNRTKLGPWYSWRDSYLSWPDSIPEPLTAPVFRLLNGPAQRDMLSVQFAGLADADDFRQITNSEFDFKLATPSGTFPFQLDSASRTLEGLIAKINSLDVKTVPEIRKTVPELQPVANGKFQLRLAFLVFPPVFDRTTHRLWPFHPFFRGFLDQLLSELDGPQPKYSVELTSGPVRGDGRTDAPGGGVNSNSRPAAATPSTLDGFLAANNPEADPHGWGILQRMGLAIGFRVRDHKTGEYVLGSDLANLIQSNIAATFSRYDSPSVRALKQYLHVEFLFQPGARTALGADEELPVRPRPKSETLPYGSLLAQARLVLRPVVTQRMKYQAVTITGLNGGTRFIARISTTKDEVEYMLKSGTPGIPTKLIANQEQVLQLVMPSRGSQVILFRGKFDMDFTVTVTDLANHPLPNQPRGVSFRPLDWDAAGLSFAAKAPWHTDNTTPPLPAIPDVESISPQESWSRFGRHLQKVRPGLTLPATEQEFIDTLAWLNRFFIEGGDVPPVRVVIPEKVAVGTAIQFKITALQDGVSYIGPDGTGPNWTALPKGTSTVLGATMPASSMPVLLLWGSAEVEAVSPAALTVDLVDDNGTVAARTGPGPWITSAYPRASTPLALTPDSAGRITYFHLVEDLWGHINRYYLRPQGRYDLIWAGINNSPRLFDPKNKALGVVAEAQRTIDPPTPGGMDVVLERIRPLAAPLVLSSRRLDVPVPAGQSGPPGATWEVIVAEHSEQTLIQKNRSLVNRLGFRQVAHTMIRSFTAGGTINELRPALHRVISGAFNRSDAQVAQHFKLVVGTTEIDINLGATTTLDNLAAAINAQTAVVHAEVTADNFHRLVLTPSAAAGVFPLQLKAVENNAETDFVSEPLDLAETRFEIPVNSVPTHDPKRLPPPPLPGPLAVLDHLDPRSMNEDEALTLDLPLRSTQFTQGLMALQWQSLPFFYNNKMLLVAQSSAVVSPITTIEHRDFQYISPAPHAEMEGVEITEANGDRSRRRRILISLSRLWDCLPGDAQQKWGTEDPAKVENDNPQNPQSKLRRHSSIPDRDTIYQIIVSRPSQNIEVIAEFRYALTELALYESREMHGPFRGDPIRLLPPADEAGVGARFIQLETLLTRVTGQTNEDVFEAISSGTAFATADDRGVAIEIQPKDITACVLQLNGELSDPARTALQSLIGTTDESFAQALRQLLGSVGPGRYAEACIGLEQLTELHDRVSISVAQKTLTWVGPMTAAQVDIIKTHWLKVSLFGNALTALIDGQVAVSFPDGDPNNPVQGAVTLPATRLEIKTDQLVWSKILTDPPTPVEIAAITALRGQPNLPAAVISGIDTLLARLADPAHVTLILQLDQIEPAWKPRPIQADLLASLQPLLLIGNAVMKFNGLMTRAEGESLRDLAGLTLPDQQAAVRLFNASLNGGLGGGTLRIRARRGSAVPKDEPILGTLVIPEP